MDSSRSIQLSNLPVVQDPKGLVELLEEITGKGTVIACKLRTPKSNKSRMYAHVQFASPDLAKVVRGLASGGLITVGQNKLTSQYLERDIVAKAKSMPTRIEEGKLYLGNLISQNVFSFLWNSGNSVAAEFGFDIRKLSIFLSERYIDYKLELAFRDIRHLHLRYASGSKILLIQLLCAPKIYYKDEACSSNGTDEKLVFYKDSSDTWVRTTDFTSFYSIGQSSSLCFALPHGSNISQIRENFSHYKEIGETERLSLVSGTSFSSPRLVPILSPPMGLDVPFEILFQVNSFVQSGLLSGPSLSSEFFYLLHPEWIPYVHINMALVKIGSLRNTCYDPVKLIKKEYENLKKIKKFRRHTGLFEASVDNGLMYVYRVQVTPSKVYFFGPEINVSNRVTREYAKYINNFLRVTFIDENGNRLYSTDLSQKLQNGVGKSTKLYKRVLSVLKEGIVIGSKKFDFLAFSTSQLRESSVWFFASTGEVNAESIREWMGDFLAIKNVAKCAARMGQSFSSSTETLHVYPHEIKDIPDIWIEREGKKYIFSDGIGKISLSLAKEVASKCNCDYVPSAFQIRIGGYKGVVAVHPQSPYKLSLRPSMNKYESNNSNLDVLSWTKFRPCYLNRQVITLLSTLGVGDQNFEKMQEEAVRNLDDILSNRAMALEVLQVMHVGDSHNVLLRMLSAGYLPDSEPYLSMILHAFRASKLFELRCKARIFVPKGACLMGCLDESRTLKYGEVFIQVSRTPGVNRFHDTGLHVAQQLGIDTGTSIIEGKVIVAKNPCLHPGDLRVLSAVDNPSLAHMVDCVVFPQQGERPHPDECSGSDLDGDQYFVSWDKSLIPPQQDQPMDYVAKPADELDHEVTIEEIQEYFADYMLNDTLGIISNRHTVYADQEPNMARSEICLELARLFSTAVDFPKTGIPAQIPASLTPKEYPDFMEKEDKPMYESKRIIGKLYRAIKKVATEALFINSFTMEVAQKSYDEDLEVLGYENYIDEALMFKNWYDTKLATLMYHYGVKYEAEIISGNIFSLSKLRGSKFGDLKETIMIQMKALKKEVRSWFDDGESSFDYDKYAKASAWYHVTYHPDYWGFGDYEGKDENNPHFISFPWVIYDKLLRIKREDW